MAKVILKDIKKSYENGFVAVHNFNLEIEDKEFIVLVGPSGCGKTTTLRMIAGLEEITEGKLLIDGKEMNNVHPKDRDIAMVFQNYALYPHMNVFDNMGFGLKLRKFPKNEIKERVDEAAKILGIENLLTRKPKQLSGGQRQRVAVGRAIVRKPKVFLFDEPLSNLDAKLRVQMRTEISKLHKKLGATMVYVTHDQTEAMTMGDRIVVMKDGKIQQIDTPLNLYNNPVNKFVAGFIGSPSMNFIKGKLIEDNGIYFVSEKGGIKFQLKNGTEKYRNFLNADISIGIRPENMIVIENGNNAGYITFTSEIEVLEPMGNEIYLYFLIDEIQYVLRTNPGLKAKVGDKIQIGFELTKTYFFDNKSEEKI